MAAAREFAQLSVSASFIFSLDLKNPARSCSRQRKTGLRESHLVAPSERGAQATMAQFCTHQFGFVPRLQLVVGAHTVVVWLLASTNRRCRGAILVGN